MGNVEKTIACLKELGGFKPSVDNFEDKLKVQKIVYLLGLKGVGTGFKYGFYARGPYSPELTRELYGRRVDFEKLNSSAKLSVKEKDAVRELKEKFEMKPSLLEVAATYAYFVAEEKLDSVAALKKVKRVKPFYSETQVAVGISRVKEYLFPPSPQEIESMKKEMRAWESAGDGNAEN